ncbi:hypothetical protein KSS87_004613 [Heliosperma pusillum]|nr:hypothetical protein KSS87_004613 [Heliosperma pusillum]
MGFDNDCILNIQSLSGEYFCAVCRTLVYPNEAIQGSCTHLYCKPCLAYVVSTTHACPYDGYRVTEADTKPLLEANKTLADTIGKIQVHCLYYRTGCTWQGSLSDCTSHCLKCAFGESAVICNRCEVQLKHRQMQEHAQKCYGVHCQVQQPGGGQDKNSTGPTAAPCQTKTAVQTGGPVSQPTSQVSTSVVSSHVASQTANPATQPTVAQAAMPTAEQMCHQQLQYQHQQSAGSYYHYPQVVQQYQQPQAQAYPQAYGQPQPLGSSQTQAQIQPVVQAQQQVVQRPQAHASPQVYGQPLPLGSSQTQTRAQIQPMQAQQQVHPQALNHGAQPPLQSEGQASMPHALSVNPTRPPSVAHPYTQPQPLPQPQLLVPHYPQTHPRMQHPPLPPYPHPQTQGYPQQQPQVHSQPRSEPNPQAPVPSCEPIPPSNHLQTLNTVSGYQSYPQPQLNSQAQTCTQHLSNCSKNIHGQFPLSQFPMETTQIRPPQYYSNVPNQHQPATLPAQGPPPSGPPAHQPYMYPQAQQPGNLFHQRPSLQATQQGFAVQGSSMQHQPSMIAQSHIQGPSQMPPPSQQNYGQPPGAQPNVAHNYAGRPLGLQAVAHPYAQPTGHAGAGQVRPPQLNQNYPMETNDQLSRAEQLATQTQHVLSSEKSCDPMLEKGGQVRPQLYQNYPMKTHGQLSSTEQLATQFEHVTSSEKSRDPMLEKGGQVRPQLNQNYPIKMNNQLSSAEQLGSQSQHVSSSEKPRDQMLEEGVHDQNNTSKEDRDMDMASSAGSRRNEVKRKAKNDSGASADECLRESCFSGSKQMLDAVTNVDNFVQEANPTAKQETGEGVSKTPGDVDITVSDNAFKKANGQEVKRTAKHAAGTSALRKTHLKSQFHGENSHPSTDQRSNQLQPLPCGHNKSDGSFMPQSMGHHVNSQQPASLGHTSYQLRPQGPGQAPCNPLPLKNPSVGILGPASAGSLGKTGNVNYVQGNLFYHHASQPQNSSGDHVDRPTFTTHTHWPGASGRAIDNFGAQRHGRVDDRQPASPPHGPIEWNSFGHGAQGIQQGDVTFGGSSARDSSMPGPGMWDERTTPFFEHHSKHLPHKEFEDDYRKSLRPSHSEAGASNFGMVLPSSGQLDHGSLLFGRDRTSGSFDAEPHGFDRDPGFGRALMDGLSPRSPAKDYHSFPFQTFGPDEDAGRNESWSFESSKPYNYSAEPLRKPSHESRFLGHPRGNLDLPDNLQLGEHFAHNQDFMPSHLQRSGHMGEAAAFGFPAGLSRREPPVGFKNGQGFQHFAHDDGFYPREMGHMRKRKPGSMCQICNVDCGTVEGLELHSQCSDHQRNAKDIVLRIKQQNNKMQKVSRDRASVQEGRDRERPKNSGCEGR